jgi:hypothetical protein
MGASMRKPKNAKKAAKKVKKAGKKVKKVVRKHSKHKTHPNLNLGDEIMTANECYTPKGY